MQPSTNASLEAGSNTDISSKKIEAGMATPQTIDASTEAQITESEPSAPVPLLSDARLYIIGLGIWIALFLAAFETTVVATSLVDITSEFQDFNRASWIVVVYLLTYNGFLLLSSKLCDILGIKSMFLGAIFIFGVFSIACGAAQNMTQLIIFRAFQGIGGGGIYCISFILMLSIITKEKLGTFSGGISSVFAIASICGPLLGGVITEKSTWRWIFYLNGPGVVVAFAILYFAIPDINQVKMNRQTLSRIDFGGGFLSVAWSILLVYALQEGGAEYPWSHSVILGTLISGIVGLFIFAGYEWYIARKSSVIEPIFPLRLLKSPAFTYLVLTTFCIGVPIYVTIIVIPQRYQIVNGVSPIRSGVLLLPMLVVSPVMSLIPGLALKTYWRYVPYGFAVGGILSVAGSAGLGVLGYSDKIEAKTYGFLVLLGAGMGLVMPIGVMLVKFICDPKDEAVALGAQNMTRVLGGLVGLAIGTAILHQKVEHGLPGVLSPEQLHALLKSPQVLATLQPDQLIAVRKVYAASYDLQFNMATGFAALGTVFSILTTYYILQVMKTIDAEDFFSTLGLKKGVDQNKTESEKKAEDA
ncbi:hypothetical protein AOL_s00043g375 [Orbilia oligospora ATCC 24927]|uniref:Major facilitator superfamily (MFS) profile domain-containing protein n=2 Tax=Orbilia oligospora TaxID=2813651 RepID=G1X3V1_ARTOA|nr:hypothetical protein AOL_s00043g375 [Orbilia oligospora ATCC 24927]EGX52232.1 hypothetical protein AOL_s00043g375 [Orbilia oligospora ATCC 24927]KAF3289469.1 hypothetical protein TWF970_003245 [Orbilia oligospora]